MDAFLNLTDVRYSYHSPEGETPALSDISFSVKGRIFTFPNFILHHLNPAYFYGRHPIFPQEFVSRPTHPTFLLLLEPYVK